MARTKQIARPKPRRQRKKKNPAVPAKGITRQVSSSPTPDIPVTANVERRRKLVSTEPQLKDHILYVFIGPALELVTLHSNLLPEATQRYIADLSAGLATFQLTSEDPTIFQIYRSWLYEKQLYTIGNEDGDNDSYKDAEWSRIADCYVIGVTLRDERFANACLSAMVEKMVAEDVYPTGIAGDVYDYTSDGDKLRQMLVDTHVWKGLGQWIQAPHGDADAPAGFIRDVMNSMANAGSEIYEEDSKAPWETDLCGTYHTHEVSEKCADGTV